MGQEHKEPTTSEFYDFHTKSMMEVSSFLHLLSKLREGARKRGIRLRLNGDIIRDCSDDQRRSIIILDMEEAVEAPE